MIISIIIAIIVLIYVLNLERDNCDCSKDWKRDYVKYGSMSIIIYSIVITICNLYINKINNNMWFRLLLFIYGLYILSYAIVSIIYFIDLQKHNDCECSRNWKRYSLIAPMIAILIALLLTVIAVIYLRTFLKLNKKNSKKMLNKLFKNKK